MTLTEILDSAAGYLGTTQAAFTVNSQNLGLVALNQARNNAELNHDFEFTRKLAQLTIDGVTGGSLDAAVLYGTATAVEPKTVLEVGVFDADGNFRPVEWTTTAESLERQRTQRYPVTDRYPTDGTSDTLDSLNRVVFTGRQAYLVPKVNGAQVVLGLEIYAMTADWAAANLTSTFAPWTTKGSQYLMWQTVIHLNHLFGEFIPRQEGNLAPPKDMADEGLNSLITWDIMQFEQFRRHSRG